MIYAKQHPAHVSASQLSTYRDCPRKWWYNKVAGMPTPTHPSAALGSAVHETLEAWLISDGETMDGSPEVMQIISAAIDSGTLPDPAVEGMEAEAKVELPGPMPILGFADVIDWATSTIMDYKTTGNPRYALNEDGLRQSWQSIIYSAWLLKQGASKVTFRHIYMTTRAPFKSWTVQVQWTPETIAEPLAHVHSVIREMIDAASITMDAHVEVNTSSCRKYGGCPFTDVCSKSKLEKEKAMNLADKIKARKVRIKQSFNPPDGVKQETVVKAQPAPEPAPKQSPQPEPQAAAPRPYDGASRGSVLYVGCQPHRPGDDTEWLHHILEPILAEVATEHGVVHYGMLAYGKGKTAAAAKLAAFVAQHGVPRNLVLDTRQSSQNACLEILAPFYETVVERFG